MNPFGWRFVGIMLGILMLPLLYILLKQLFNNTFISLFGTILWATDFMHYTQTHIATIDTYNVLFVLLMFIFIHRWMAQPHDTPLLYTLPYLFLTGLSFGLGAAAKWSSIYAGLGLIALYIWKIVARTRWARDNGRPWLGFIVGTLLASLLFFIAVPAWVYLASYIPYLVNGKELTLENLFNAAKDNSISMFNYHSQLKSTHSYQARWYLWLFDIRPICYFYRSSDGIVSVIDAFNNPALSWCGLLAIVAAAVDAVRKRAFAALFAVIGFFAVMLPWMVISRTTFAYHYFPANIFLIVALCYVVKRAMEFRPEKEVRKKAILLLAVSGLLFVVFFPAISGLPIPYGYTHYILQWFPSWPF
jgi:dolichyl-phosphate-mannose--protein O-mannosyl transferase